MTGSAKVVLLDVRMHIGFAVQYLWGLLQERKPEQNISHDGKTTFEQHEAFVRGRNDRLYWYLVLAYQVAPCGKNWPVGTVYLTARNEIGIQIQKSDQRKGIARAAVEALMGRHPLPYYLANVAPGNEASHAFWRALPGSKVIQHTYRITRGEDHA